MAGAFALGEGLIGMPDNPYYIAIESEVEAGLWCDRCALPSQVQVILTLLCPHGVTTLGYVTGCPDHPADVTLTNTAGLTRPAAAQFRRLIASFAGDED